MLGSGCELPGEPISNASLFEGIERHCGKAMARKAALQAVTTPMSKKEKREARKAGG